MHRLSDGQIVKQVQNGDVEVYGQIVKKYQARLLSFVSRFIYDRQKAEEITQDAFVDIYKTIDRVDPTRKFSTYLFAVAKNASISYLRRKKREVSLEGTSVDNLQLAANKTMYEDFNRRYTIKKVRSAVATLSSIYRTVIELYYFKELSYSQVGQELNLPLNTVKTRLRRAKHELASILEND